MKNLIEKFSKIFNWAVCIYLLLVAILNFCGKITFGFGLGDIYYLGWLIFICLLSLLLNIKFRVEKHDNTGHFVKLLFGIIFLAIAIYFTEKFTINRGIEYPWNGNIFY